MKKMRLTILFLLVAAFACAQEGEYVRGVLKVDTVHYKEFSVLPSNAESGYFINYNGYPFWYDGVAWDTIGRSGGGGYLPDSTWESITANTINSTGDLYLNGSTDVHISTSNEKVLIDETDFSITNADFNIDGQFYAPGMDLAVTGYVAYVNIANGKVTYGAASPGISYTAGNGMYLNGTEFELGDTLNRHTIINTGGYNYAIETESVADAASSRFLSLEDGRTTLVSYDDATYSSTADVTLNLWKDYLELSYNGAINSNFLAFADSGIYIQTDISGRGLMAAGYYGGSITDNDYAQKKYVDDAIDAAGGVSSGMRDTIDNLYQQVFGDTVDLAALTRLKIDTIPLVPWVKGEGLSADSASFRVGSSIIIKWESSAGDTLVVDNFCGNVDAAAKSATVKVEIDDTYAFSSPTTIMAATAITGSSAAGTGQYITTFTNQEIPPGSYIKMSFTALSADKPNRFLGQLNGHMKN